MAVPIKIIDRVHDLASKNKLLTAKVSLVLAILFLLGNFLPSYLNSKIITDKKEYIYKEYTYKGYDKVWEGGKKHGTEYIYIYTDELNKPITVYTFCNDYVKTNILANHENGEKIQIYLEEWDGPTFNHYAHEIVIDGDIALSFDDVVQAQKKNNIALYYLFNIFAGLLGLVSLVFYLEYKGVKVP
ncbi:MAG: hypothetical protein E7533_06685 [Ruminococcaceae bacterium]|nr:hypothetical protein [Oscillospiraceae bacterium]